MSMKSETGEKETPLRTFVKLIEQLEGKATKEGKALGLLKTPDFEYHVMVAKVRKLPTEGSAKGDLEHGREESPSTRSPGPG